MTRCTHQLLALSACTLVLGLGLAACASPDTTGAAKAPVYERSDTLTGSNLPKKANKPSNVQVVDPEAMQGAARGATRNSGN